MKKTLAILALCFIVLVSICTFTAVCYAEDTSGEVTVEGAITDATATAESWLDKALQIVKDYGSAIISTISVGGIAAVAGVIGKVKSGIDKTKDLINKKEAEQSELKTKYEAAIAKIQEQNAKIDRLTDAVEKIEHME